MCERIRAWLARWMYERVESGQVCELVVRDGDLVLYRALLRPSVIATQGVAKLRVDVETLVPRYTPEMSIVDGTLSVDLSEVGP